CRDLVPESATGLLVPPRDTQALADALRRLANDPGMRRRMGAAARELACTRFSQETVADQTQELYRRLLDGGGIARGT
ncbi:glycosyltransferase, partial [Tritonibacter sp. SIMBA_163]|uniref:glycosyltransferase n=1 Tax=Tritonibacter sp. SIMBA_163 TaxID=3080868 RepID=UPI003980DF52